MYNQKVKNRVFRHRRSVMLQAVSVIILLLSVTIVPSAVGKELTGIVKETPGVGWPCGIWVIGDQKVSITEQTLIKGDQSKAYFGAKVIVKGRLIHGVFIAYELEVRTDDEPLPLPLPAGSPAQGVPCAEYI